MKILLDLQGCQSTGSRQRGIGRYSAAFARALIERGGNHEFWLLLNGAFRDASDALRASFADVVPASRVMQFHVPSGCAEIADPWKARAAEVLRGHAIERAAPDLVHVSSLFEGLGDDSAVCIQARPGQPATAVTLYDLIPYLYESRYLADPRTRAWYMRKLESLCNADLLCGISQSACEEATTALGGRLRGGVVNVSSAADPLMFSPEGSRTAPARFGLHKPFVMYTGGIDWRKNIEGLIDAFASLPLSTRQAHQLALVCDAQPAAKAQAIEHARKAGLFPGDLVLTGYVSNEDLADLYRSCALFVFPSLHEGFGLPALEAMMCGAAVIGSNTSSIPEVIGRSDALFDPRSTQDIAAVMGRALAEPAFLQSLRNDAIDRAAQFSWAKSAQRALDAFEQLQPRAAVRAPGGSQTPPPRHSLAMVTPLPPLQSGIAEYVIGLTRALRLHYDVELVTDQLRVELPPELSDLPVRTTQWLRSHAGGDRRVLYHFGNSEFHAHMFELLRAVPGVVVLHDFYLGDVLNWMEMIQEQRGALLEELFGSHGAEALQFVKAHGRVAALAAYPANRSVLQWASGIIVQSQFALNAAERFYGAGAARGWRHIPLPRALPAVAGRAAARTRLGIPQDAVVVCSFGHVGPTKLNHSLIEAWQGSALARNPKYLLVMVGDNATTRYGNDIERRVRKLGGQAWITGYADRSAYEDWLCACDLAVQLRSSSRGETSGAVLDCLAHGVPVIVNATGTNVEYPPGVVELLPEHFTRAELVSAMEHLSGNREACQQISRVARAWVGRHHDPAAIASRYVEAIEAYAREPLNADYRKLVRGIAELGAAQEASLGDAAAAIAETLDELPPGSDTSSRPGTPT